MCLFKLYPLLYVSVFYIFLCLLLYCHIDFMHDGILVIIHIANHPNNDERSAYILGEHGKFKVLSQPDDFNDDLGIPLAQSDSDVSEGNIPQVDSDLHDQFDEGTNNDSDFTSVVLHRQFSY